MVFILIEFELKDGAKIQLSVPSNFGGIYIYPDARSNCGILTMTGTLYETIHTQEEIMRRIKDGFQQVNRAQTSGIVLPPNRAN